MEELCCLLWLPRKQFTGVEESLKARIVLSFVLYKPCVGCKGHAICPASFVGHLMNHCMKDCGTSQRACAGGNLLTCSYGINPLAQSLTSAIPSRSAGLSCFFLFSPCFYHPRPRMVLAIALPNPSIVLNVKKSKKHCSSLRCLMPPNCQG